jgi:hypothetical protein
MKLGLCQFVLKMLHFDGIQEITDSSSTDPSKSKIAVQINEFSGLYSSEGPITKVSYENGLQHITNSLHKNRVHL